MIINTCKELFEGNIDLEGYLNSDLINELYFKPKRVDKNIIHNKLNDSTYMSKVKKTIDYYKNMNLEKVISDKIHDFEIDINYTLDDYKIYVIIGLNTTTIYSTKYNDEDVTVLLLESTDGIMENLDMLLAHEFTHFVRRQVFKKDIFENSIGERFIVEGIGCNYSREIVPGKEDYIYCIVSPETTIWVKDNMDKIEKHFIEKIGTNELMRDYFYMFADMKETGLYPRTGYVYGYLIIKDYLEKNNLKIKDIITKPWEELWGLITDEGVI